MEPSEERSSESASYYIEWRFRGAAASAQERFMLPSLRNALLIHNPNAGNGGKGRRRMLDEARRILSLGGIEADLQETRAPGDATVMAQRATVEGRQLVIACGGDGTLNEAVNGLAAQQDGHRVPMALLPGGTANVLAKEIGLPWDIPAAAEKLVRGESKATGASLATPLKEPSKARYFLSVAGAGPDGMIVYSIDLDLKARVGILAYWWQGAREVFRYKFPHFRVVTGEKTLDATLVVVGRTKHYGGPFRITTEADLYAHQFEMIGVTTQSGFRYLSYLSTLWLRNIRATEGLRCWQAHRTGFEPID